MDLIPKMAHFNTTLQIKDTLKDFAEYNGFTAMTDFTEYLMAENWPDLMEARRSNLLDIGGLPQHKIWSNARKTFSVNVQGRHQVNYRTSDERLRAIKSFAEKVDQTPMWAARSVILYALDRSMRAENYVPEFFKGQG